MSVFLPFMFVNSMLFMLLKHPLTCGMTLLIQTILISMITGFMHMNFWFSYILFLIMIGGMLILFLYMTSIASNEKFKLNMNIMFMLMILFFFTIMLMTSDPLILNLETQMIEMKLNQKLNHSLSMTKYFNFPNLLMLLLIINYLFLTLIAIVKITSLSYGPLRQKF
uniref:NADH-ubiquinone oxidoreductase chain 6 n=1 Tax=Galerucella sp. EMHAU-15070821 TaxID=2480061 RepID=A0A3G2EZ06_9CUCU|nr:NADH dehydrogenase subunit 6 [Galerucella sp. EMHAU-15070821]